MEQNARSFFMNGFLVFFHSACFWNSLKFVTFSFKNALVFHLCSNIYVAWRTFKPYSIPEYKYIVIYSWVDVWTKFPLEIPQSPKWTLLYTSSGTTSAKTNFFTLRVELLYYGLGTCAVLLDNAQLFSKVVLLICTSSSNKWEFRWEDFFKEGILSHLVQRAPK